MRALARTAYGLLICATFGTPVAADTRVALGRLRVPLVAPSVAASSALKLDVLRRAGVPVPAVGNAAYTLTVAQPVAAKAWLAYIGADALYPRDNLAVLNKVDAFVVVEWANTPGAVYLLDCEMSPNTTAAKFIDMQLGSTTQPVAVVGGHVLLAVPAGPGQTRTAYLHGGKAQIFFRGCEITKVK